MMPSIQIFEPALCCSTGVCGVDVDQTLVTFTADVAWLKEQGGQIERFNLAQQPMVFADNAELKQRPAVAVLLPEDIIRIRLRDLIKGVPSKVDVKGYDPKSKQTVSASRSSKSRRGKAKHGSTGDTLRIVPNKGESAAQLNARADAKLADAQDDQCAGTVTLVGNALLVAGQMVRLKEFGKFSGKYLVKQSRHDFTRHVGWTTELEIKMTEYVADEEKNNANP